VAAILDESSFMGNAKILAHCIYCTRPPDGEEHWLPRSLGTFRGNSLL
jgi:hypothetical protein